MTHFLTGLAIILAVAVATLATLGLCLAAVSGDAQDRGDAMAGRRR